MVFREVVFVIASTAEIAELETANASNMVAPFAFQNAQPTLWATLHMMKFLTAFRTALVFFIQLNRAAATNHRRNTFTIMKFPAHFAANGLAQRAKVLKNKETKRCRMAGAHLFVVQVVTR